MTAPKLGGLAMLVAGSIGQAAIAALPVDLDTPGALDRLAVERPQHHQRVARILHDARTLPEKEVIGVLRVQHRADDATFGPTLLTSFPPQRRLSFSLDAVQYRATVPISAPPPTAIPAR